MKSKVAAVLALALILSASVSLPVHAVTTSNGVHITVFPDGSIHLAFNSFVSEMLSPGTMPSLSSNLKAITVGEKTTISVNETETVPTQDLNQAPFNYSTSMASSGSYSNGMSSGSLTVQAVPGVSFPGASMKANYHGDGNSLSVSGNVTLQYGSYGSGQDQFVVDQTTIAQGLQMLQREGLNSSNIQNVLAKASANFSEGKFSLTSFTLTPVYGTNSATVNGDLELAGNMTALPFFIAFLYYGLIVGYLSSFTGTLTMTTTTATSTSGSSALPPSFYDILGASSVVMSSVQSYTYTMSYASGILALSEKFVTAQNLNLDQALTLLAKHAAGLGATPSEVQFLNTTRVDISGLSAVTNDNQKPSGEYDINISMTGLTLYPQVTESGGILNESALFHSLGGGGPTNVTVAGGTNAEGSVTVVVPPAGVPAPTQSTASSKSWTDVNASSLRGLEFSVTPTSSTSSTSSSSTTSPSATSSSSSQSGGGGIPEFPVQSGFALLVTIAIVTSYILARRSVQINRRPGIQHIDRVIR